MQKLVAILLSGVSLAGAAAHAQPASGEVPAWAAEAQMNPDYEGPIPSEREGFSAGQAPAAGAEAPEQASESAPAVAGEKPAWAAEAQMNPDYEGPIPGERGATTDGGSETAPADAAASEEQKAADDAAAAAAQAEEEAAAKRKAEEEAAAAAAAEEKRKEEEAAAAAAAEEKRKEEEAVAAKAAAEAEMEARRKAEEEAEAAAKAAQEAQRQQVVEACRDSLNAELASAKLSFATGRWDVQPSSYRGLDKLAQIAKDCGDVVIEVGGHTDNLGKPESNVTISQLRAESVVKYLTRAGVEAAKLKAVGYGETKPVQSNDTADGRRQNRRIDFTVAHSGSSS
jgi:outer membrane protein OmpA-like peptidoglycan-associated protein